MAGENGVAMPTVNMLEAKTTLSRLVEAVESGAEKEIVIARNGKPAARLVPLEPMEHHARRLGSLTGKYPPLDLESFNASDAEIAGLLAGKS